MIFLPWVAWAMISSIVLLPSLSLASAVAVADSKVVAPQAYFHPKPPVPASAIRRHKDGKVVVHYKVTADGRVSAVIIKSSCGFRDLNQSACTAILLWKFHPALRDGVAVSYEEDQTFNFNFAH